MSHEHVAHVRDAFAEAVKLKNRSDIQAHGAAAISMIVAHLHDEAAMRIRSIVKSEVAGIASSGPRISRGQSTKVVLRYHLHEQGPGSDLTSNRILITLSFLSSITDPIISHHHRILKCKSLHNHRFQHVFKHLDTPVL